MNKTKQITTTVTLLFAMALMACTPQLQQPEVRQETEKAQTAQEEKTDAEGTTTEGQSTPDQEQVATEGQSTPDADNGEGEAESDGDSAAFPAADFTLTDQYGNEHSLSAYKGKVVFLNFWATWCPPCRAEMPDIQKLYTEYREANDDSVVILGVAAPNLGGEQDIAGITAFLEENGYTYPVAMDETGEVFAAYYVNAYPTTYMIDKNGSIFGYLTGSMTEDVMRDIIEQTVSGKLKSAP